MACYRPLKGYRSRTLSEKGKRPIVFNTRAGYADMPVEVPCGQCIGCRLERSRQWAMRCVHEAHMHEDNCFITLTFDDVHLPRDLSLDVRHFQLFMKRFRAKFGKGIRFYHCGEYGELFKRPHYHACIFGFDFPDKVLYKIVNGHRLYTSALLSELWPFGFSTLGDVTFESAAYVARYVLKKVNGDQADDAYRRIDPVTGEIWQVKPEYTTMSRRPGIGHEWYRKFADDVFPHDRVVVRGVEMKPPKYYDGLYEDIESMKLSRKISAKLRLDDNTPERLYVREQVQLAKLGDLPRNLDKES